MSESPAALLERAAARVEALAAKATPGPWRRHDTWLDHGGHTATVLADAQPKSPLVAWLPTWEAEPWGQERRVWQNSAWMASMSPVVAAPLVELLRDAARRIENNPQLDPSGSTFQRCALNMARAILGEHTEEDSRG